MKYFIRWPTLFGIVLTAVLVSLAPASIDRAQAQVSVRIGGGSYYAPYSQRAYGGYTYGPGYGTASAVPHGVYNRGPYAHRGYRGTAYRGYSYRNAPYALRYDRSIYYQPSYGVYVPFGIRPY